jgi:hypothetical protein
MEIILLSCLNKNHPGQNCTKEKQIQLPGTGLS